MTTQFDNMEITSTNRALFNNMSIKPAKQLTQEPQLDWADRVVAYHKQREIEEIFYNENETDEPVSKPEPNDFMEMHFDVRGECDMRDEDDMYEKIVQEEDWKTTQEWIDRESRNGGLDAVFEAFTQSEHPDWFCEE